MPLRNLKEVFVTKSATRKKSILCIVFSVSIVVALICVVRLYNYFSPPTPHDPNNAHANAVVQSFDYPVYLNEKTGQYEKIEPLPEAEPIGEEYIRISVSDMKEPIGTEILLTPSNNSNDDWLIIDGDNDRKIRRLTVACSKALGVSELVSKSPIFIQVDIQIDGEWVFGAKQELNAHEVCQFILPQRSPFRWYLWKPAGTDWVCVYSAATRWW